MALLNLQQNPFALSPFASASPQVYAKATTLGLLSKPPGPAGIVQTQAPVTPAQNLLPAPMMSAPSTTMTRGAKVPKPSAKQLGPDKPTAALATSPYRLPDGTMDEPDKPGVRDENEAGHMKRKAKRNPNDMGLVFHPEAKVARPSPNSLGYSQSYDPNGRGYKQLNGPINPQSAAALRSKFKTPSNLG